MSNNVKYIKATAFTLICTICKCCMVPHKGSGKKKVKSAYEHGCKSHLNSTQHTKNCTRCNVILSANEFESIYNAMYSDMMDIAKTAYLRGNGSKEYILQQYMDQCTSLEGGSLTLLDSVTKLIDRLESTDSTTFNIKQCSKDDKHFCPLFYECLSKVQGILSMDQSIQIFSAIGNKKVKKLEQ
jgi:hypothetical protein